MWNVNGTVVNVKRNDFKWRGQMMDKDPNHLSRPAREGKSMGEFGTADTTRKEGKQGWKVRKQILTKKLKTLK